MRIADVLRTKGSAVATIDPDVPVSELLRALAEHNIGAIVVVGSSGVAGIVSERDVVRRLHEVGIELLSSPVSAIMTADVFTCSPSDTVDSLTVVMTERRFRHVPVLSDGRLVGIVSIGDVVKSRIGQLEQSQDQLQAYISQG
ncbi:CBS domain-containing protein [Lentzea flaviverrucosa]|uniref:CBS domain-containing protein n=1 Tax=Lentzea flaviverrucosa TaxID=200379 RepID=A0A1H9XX61_9PSEU|nr:CBS domain-containing protein [Lentzea flaviverrucosa]RDI17456.1 CBS domain protein [Lentzea flaviverrucosa]SES50676.1 CBS domain-containing protein [Lentzea flaviverrucosa]